MNSMRGELELCGVLLNVSMVLRVGGGWIVMLRGYTALESLGLLFNCGIIWGFCFVVSSIAYWCYKCKNPFWCSKLC